MKQRLTILSLMLCILLQLHAQKLTVESFSELAGNLSASKKENRRVDKSGGLCGLIKVQLPLDGVTFDGAFVIGDVQRKADGYWVYMNEGAYQLHIMHPSFHPLILNLRELQPAASEGFRGVQPLCTYNLVVNVPNPTEKEEKKQKLIINYTPKSAIVLIDSKPYSNKGRAEAELPLGEHSYIIAADGYITAEGKVTLNGGNARTLTEQLEREDATIASQQTHPKESDETLTAAQMDALGETAFDAKDYAEALKWYRKAAEQGHASGQFHLGYMYENGFGVRQDKDTAKYWYEKATGQGNKYAKKQLKEIQKKETASSSADGANGKVLAVKSIEVASTDISAITHPLKDLNGEPCALVKVQTTVKGMQFGGNVVGTENKADGYWVYLTKGSYMLQIKHPNYLPLTVNFRDYGIPGVQSNTTYVLKF